MTAKVEFNLKPHIEKTGMTQAAFADMVGLRAATISQMVNNKYNRIQMDHLAQLMTKLKITDFNEILKLVDDGEES